MISFNDIALNATPVARWGYEKAYPTHVMLVFKRDDQLHDLEAWLNAKFGRSPDNKVTFKMRVNAIYEENQADYYIMFKDGQVILGLGVRPYRGDKLEQPEYPKPINP